MAGGVERMIITIMNSMAERGHEVDLLTWDLAGAQSFYPMAPEITWHRLDMGAPSIGATMRLKLKRAAKVRALVAARRPQAIVAFQDGPFRALSAYCMGLGIPVIAAERNAPTQFDHTRRGRRNRHIAFNAFRLARSIVVQCEDYRKLYPPFLRERIITIPNPVYPARLSSQPDQPDASGRFRILSVGRLSYQKNYESLIGAFSLIADKFPNWDLVIVGDGELYQKLQALIEAAGLSDRVRLPGAIPNPEEHYASAHIFCLPSRWEGFPNALAEALTHGLPAVGYADCAGVNHLIAPPRNGLLAEGNGDCGSLARALSSLMADNQLRLEMGERGRLITSAFEPEAVMDRWERVLCQSAKLK
jgi:glycosyltransferase involved in cell wall biosynthesis